MYFYLGKNALSTLAFSMSVNDCVAANGDLRFSCAVVPAAHFLFGIPKGNSFENIIIIIVEVKMKRLVCEMCGSTDILKQEGVFVCQNCGTKYTVEEARKMMVEGQVDVSGSVVKVDQSEKLKNLLTLARRARIEENTEEAKKYYELAMIEDPDSWESRFYSMYYKLIEAPVGDLSNNLQLFNKRLITTVVMLLSDDSPEGHEQSSQKLDELVNSTGNLYLSIMKHISAEHKKASDKFTVIALQSISGKISGDLDSYRDQYVETQYELFDLADSMLTAMRSAYKMIIDKEGEFVTEITLSKMLMVCEVIAGYYSKENCGYIRDRAAFGRELVRLESIAKTHDPNYTSKSLDEYYSFTEDQIKEDEKKGYSKDAKKLRIVIEDIEEEKKIMQTEIKREMMRKYWDEHPEEKEKLESRLAKIEPIRNSLREQVKNLQEQFDDLETEKSSLLPAEKEQKNIRDDIKALENRKNSLGIFKGKEKREIQEEIDSKMDKLERLKRTANRQREDKEKEIQEKEDIINNELIPLQKDLSSVDKEWKDVQFKLTGGSI